MKLQNKRVRLVCLIVVADVSKSWNFFKYYMFDAGHLTLNMF